MNRKHDSAFYRDIIVRLRRARPDIAVSTDFIVAFPGETEADFEATLNLARDVKFASAFSFRYSPRPGTPAATMHGQIAEAEGKRRLALLQALLSEQQRGFNEGCIGGRLGVLVTGRGRKPDQMHGRSPYLQAVHFTHENARPGDIVTVRIDSASQNALAGSVEAAGAA